MDHHPDLKARGTYEVRQIQDLVTRLLTIQEIELAEQTRSIIQERVEESGNIMKSLESMSEDSDAQQIVNEFYRLKLHCMRLMKSQESLTEFVKDDVAQCQVIANEVLQRDRDQRLDWLFRHRPRTIMNDFLYSLFYTIIICGIFSIVWVRHANMQASAFLV